jgi:MarR family transcriptional regulator, lower aerobic nicotinate degradation pathway regulator
MTDQPTVPPERLRALVQWQLSKASNLGARLTAEHMPAGGRSDFAMLAALREYGPLSQAELGRRLGLDRNDVNGIINRLEGATRVERGPDPIDKRRNVITITSAGARHFDELTAKADAVQDALLKALDAADRAHLRDLLARVLDSHTPPSA